MTLHQLLNFVQRKKGEDLQILFDFRIGGVAEMLKTKGTFVECS